MIIFITDKQVRKNFRVRGFKTIDDEVVGAVNKAALNFVRNVLKKTVAKNKTATEIEGRHVQAGGRVLMPAEYYGVETNHHVADPKWTDMNVTAELIRPPFTASDTVVMEGGNHGGFHLSLQVVKNMCTEILNTTKISNVTLKQTAHKKIQAALEDKLSQVLVSLRRQVKGDHVTKKDIAAVFAMSKYKSLQSAA